MRRGFAGGGLQGGEIKDGNYGSGISKDVLKELVREAVWSRTSGIKEEQVQGRQGGMEDIHGRHTESAWTMLLGCRYKDEQGKGIAEGVKGDWNGLWSG